MVESNVKKEPTKCKGSSNKILKRSQRKSFIFDVDEEARLISGSKLSDISINLAHNLLSLQNPEFSGFQNSFKGSRLRFEEIPPGSKYVQILHDKENDHWICLG